MFFTQHAGAAVKRKAPPSQRRSPHTKIKQHKTETPHTAAVASNDEDEHKVQSILGHSCVPDHSDGSAMATQFLVAWAGTDAATGQPWPATWQSFCDVGEPLIAGYFHRLATVPGPKPVPTAPDAQGRVYTYVDAAVAHQPIPPPPSPKQKTARARTRRTADWDKKNEQIPFSAL